MPIPSLVICELLGVPYADRDDFQRRSNQLVDVSRPREELMRAMRESDLYMADLVARAKAGPGDDMLGMLVREHAGELSDAELKGVCGLLLVAGHETTANMLGLGTLAMLRHPEQLALLREEEEPERVDAAVEELLRWLTVANSSAIRVTTTDVELSGRRIPAGEVVMCSLAAANRDPELLADADRFDITRDRIGHIGFGHGPHHCLGAPLARMELRIALPALLKRFPGLREAEPEPRFNATHLVYGLSSLQVAW